MPLLVAVVEGPAAPQQRILVKSVEGGSGVFAVLDNYFVGRRCQHLGTTDDFDSGLGRVLVGVSDGVDPVSFCNLNTTAVVSTAVPGSRTTFGGRAENPHSTVSGFTSVGLPTKSVHS